ncbi:hypothetical protein EZV73_09255 [Acidaminobacter sp. JC074]|uniref:hypothetical protein n=1 Tax=Acidaminobacter sp. JC074 TaxID=2530199 RepID=UPI001F108346|nr:hypothetical protein [Acidaminobacter sp. JC074]MCH4887760.1 hypothetical protein [Acidaminobacter sp. JC074]
MSPFIILLGLIPSVIIFFLGRYIGMTQYVDVLKSYDEKKTYDKAAFALYVKKLMYFTAIATGVMCIVMLILALLIKTVDFVSIALVLYIILNLNYVIRLRMSGRKFEVN